MEPVLGGRDDDDGHRDQGQRRDAAMEPVLGGRDDQLQTPRCKNRCSAAMEPVLGGRDDVTMTPMRASSPGRNGARPWRTGRLAQADLVYTFRTPPQWSPSLADGTTLPTVSL